MEKISLGDEAIQQHAVDLYRQLTAAYTLHTDKGLIGQVTGDVLAEIRADPSLCASFLYLVGTGFKALMERIAEGTGIPVQLLIADAFTGLEMHDE